MNFLFRLVLPFLVRNFYIPTLLACRDAGWLSHEMKERYNVYN